MAETEDIGQYNPQTPGPDAWGRPWGHPDYGYPPIVASQPSHVDRNAAMRAYEEERDPSLKPYFKAMDAGSAVGFGGRGDTEAYNRFATNYNQARESPVSEVFRRPSFDWRDQDVTRDRAPAGASRYIAPGFDPSTFLDEEGSLWSVNPGGGGYSFMGSAFDPYMSEVQRRASGLSALATRQGLMPQASPEPLPDDRYGWRAQQSPFARENAAGDATNMPDWAIDPTAEDVGRYLAGQAQTMWYPANEQEIKRRKMGQGGALIAGTLTAGLAAPISAAAGGGLLGAAAAAGVGTGAGIGGNLIGQGASGAPIEWENAVRAGAISGASSLLGAGLGQLAGGAASGLGASAGTAAAAADLGGRVGSQAGSRTMNSLFPPADEPEVVPPGSERFRYGSPYFAYPGSRTPFGPSLDDVADFARRNRLI